MESTVNLSEKTFELRIPIERWLVQESGGYSIGQLASGHLLVLERGDEDQFFQVYEYVDFDALRNGDALDVGNEVPNFVVRETARALGITHVKAEWREEPVAVDDYYKPDEWEAAFEEGQMSGFPVLEK